MAHTTLPVRTVVLTKLEDAFAAIPELKKVNLFHAVPDDLMAVELPALYLFEVQPEDRGYKNRVATAIMH